MLPAEWSRVMGPKDWLTTSEDSYRQAAAANHWFRQYCASDRSGSLGDALFSKLVMPITLIRRTGPAPEMFCGRPYLSLGHYTWGALVLPMRVVSEAENRITVQPYQETQLEWLHITRPRQWEAMSWRYLSLLYEMLLKNV